jgi:tricarballylate dehydrogenase
VVGCGNAALCAAISARESGADVVVFERAPRELRGGNSAFTAGIMRASYESLDELRELLPDLDESEVPDSGLTTYPPEQYLEDIGRVTEYRADPELTDTLVSETHETLAWMRGHGVRFQPMYTASIDGSPSFSGVPTIDVWGGGEGLVEALAAEAERLGVEIHYDSEVVGLVRGDTGITAVEVRKGGRTTVHETDAVVLAAGGFSANREWRARYLGPDWDLVKVRGSRFNTGGGIRIAFEVGAAPAGHWSGCHSISWDRNAGDFGDPSNPAAFQRHSYPLGIVVNADGKRFLDEGADFRNITYSKYGRKILAQPQQSAWQVFDAKVTPLLHSEYHLREVTKVKAATLEALAERLEGVDAEQFLETVAEFNAAVQEDIPFNPDVKDGRGTVGLAQPKSNWANTISEGPFEAYQVTCGITFTFGGIWIDSDAAVLDDSGEVIPGLFACGEMAGGLFYFAGIDGLGLTYGSVFGRRAGRGAAQAA